jgi:hypothetical protein
MFRIAEVSGRGEAPEHCDGGTGVRRYLSFYLDTPDSVLYKDQHSGFNYYDCLAIKARFSRILAGPWDRPQLEGRLR